MKPAKSGFWVSSHTISSQLGSRLSFWLNRVFYCFLAHLDPLWFAMLRCCQDYQKKVPSRPQKSSHPSSRMDLHGPFVSGCHCSIWTACTYPRFDKTQHISMDSTCQEAGRQEHLFRLRKKGKADKQESCRSCTVGSWLYSNASMRNYKRHKASKAKLSLIPASRVTFHAAPLFLKQAPQCAVKSLAMFNIEDSFLKLLVRCVTSLRFEVQGSGYLMPCYVFIKKR